MRNVFHLFCDKVTSLHNFIDMRHGDNDLNGITRHILLGGKYTVTLEQAKRVFMF